MGRLKLRLSDAIELPLKPVYLRYEILKAGLQDQSGPDPGPDPESDPGSDPGSRSRVLDPRYLRS